MLRGLIFSHYTPHIVCTRIYKKAVFFYSLFEKSYYLSYAFAHNFRDELKPKFYSNISTFQVTLYNLNYKVPKNGTLNDVLNDKQKLVLGSINKRSEITQKNNGLNRNIIKNIKTHYERTH
ncbi:MAG: hypothetical protein E7191_06145 [Erysipelotrichaceae bacterium]|nr:hypothetical protein [Erysipelotrichaceae bacterium]